MDTSGYGKFMKTLMASVIFSLCVVGINVAFADTIPLPTCVNGKWQAPAGWQLIPGYYDCTDNAINFSNVQASYILTGQSLSAFFFNSQGLVVVGAATNHFVPSVTNSGDWKWEGSFIEQCPGPGTWTNINNCPIVPNSQQAQAKH